MISRLLRNGGSVLLAAKILVISRLLHSKLSKRESPLPFLEVLRNRLAKLRRILLARVDRRFKAADVSKEALVEAMCAFALATSSSLTDVVRHFHHLRLEAMAECMDMGSRKQDAMLQALRFYVRTLRDTQALVPGQLAQALERLKMVAIFKSQDLYGLLELNLDVQERWIGEDIKTFTPYLRHADLSKLEAERLLKQWAGKAISGFLDGLKSSIEGISDPVTLAKLRKEVLELWLSQHHHSRGIDSVETLDGLRNVFNIQAISIIRSRVTDLQGVGVLIRKIVEDWREGQSDATTSLWDRSLTSQDLSNGGKEWCDSVANRLYGQNETLRAVSRKYTQWLAGISDIESTITSLRDTKWDDVLDDLDDEDEDELLDNKNVLLSQDDPQTLQNALANALTESYARLEDSLEPETLFSDRSKQGPRAVFILRTWRDLRQRLPGTYYNPHLGLRSLNTLTDDVVKSALEAPLKNCSKRVARAARRGGYCVAKPLWEGSPALPVVPSPWAYRLLLEVVQSMTSLGPDVWSPHLSKELKTTLSKALKDMLERSATTAEETPKHASVLETNGHVNGETNGDKDVEGKEEHEVGNETEETHHGDGDDDDSAESPAVKANGTHVNGDAYNKASKDDGATAAAAAAAASRDKKVQCLFDILYLSNACSNTTSSSDKVNPGGDLDDIQAILVTQAELEPKSQERIRKDAGEYWKRTKLLFALL